MEEVDGRDEEDLMEGEGDGVAEGADLEHIDDDVPRALFIPRTDAAADEGDDGDDEGVADGREKKVEMMLQMLFAARSAELIMTTKRWVIKRPPLKSTCSRQTGSPTRRSGFWIDQSMCFGKNRSKIRAVFPLGNSRRTTAMPAMRERMRAMPTPSTPSWNSLAKTAPLKRKTAIMTQVARSETRESPQERRMAAPVE